MKNKIMGMGLLALVLSSSSLYINKAEAYKGDPQVKGPNYSAERHSLMTKAFATKDYTAWKNLMQGRGKVTQVVNKDNFAKFSEAHNLALQGKKTEAEKIRQEMGLGLGQKNGSGKSFGGGRGVGSKR